MKGEYHDGYGKKRRKSYIEQIVAGISGAGGTTRISARWSSGESGSGRIWKSTMLCARRNQSGMAPNWAHECRRTAGQFLHKSTKIVARYRIYLQRTKRGGIKGMAKKIRERVRRYLLYDSEWKLRIKRFWQEWGMTGEDICDLIGAIEIIVVLPCIMAIFGSMWM